MKDKLLNSIYEYTKSGHLKWSIRPSCFNSESTHNYHCELNDGSKIQIDINLDTDLKFSHCNSLVVINKDLVDGRLYISGNKKISEIGNLVYEVFVKSNIIPKSKTQSQVIEDIINVIPTKEEMRNNRIHEIIGDVEKKFPWAISSKPKEKIEEIDDKSNKDKIDTKKGKSKLKRFLNILFGE